MGSVTTLVALSSFFANSAFGAAGSDFCTGSCDLLSCAACSHSPLVYLHAVPAAKQHIFLHMFDTHDDI